LTLKAFGQRAKEAFPWKVEIVPVDRHQGRRKDPELDIRDWALARFVQQRIDEGDGYEAAIQGTLEEIRKFAKDEGWTGKIGRDPIIEAYAADRKRSRT